MGAFLAKFSTTPSGKTMDGTQKRTYNDGTDHLYHHAKFGGNRVTHVGARG